MEIQATELTREEHLELQLAESRHQAARLAAQITARQVADTTAELEGLRARLLEAVLARRSSAAADAARHRAESE